MLDIYGHFLFFVFDDRRHVIESSRSEIRTAITNRTIRLSVIAMRASGVHRH